jgi:glycine/D-amino acid oxidase-like deaminating enzyme
MKTDFLIVGQGLAGSLLGHELLKRGYTINIIDPEQGDTSSRKAAGLYNPITGRNMVVTWLADELFARLPEHYMQLEKILDASFHHSLPIYRPFYSIEELNDWMGKENDARYSPFISRIHAQSVAIDHLNDPFGGIELRQSGYVDLPVMLDAFRAYFKQQRVYHSLQMKYDELHFDGIFHFGDFVAERIIFCDGPFVTANPWWRQLPFRPVRGEVLDISCELPTDRIYNRGVFMLPKDGIFRIGSTYDHGLLSFEPQAKGIAELQERLVKLFGGKYEIVATRAGVRPATADRRPYIGWHPENKGVGIFNGFGAKGVSLVPYFSKLFADTIEGKSKIHREADVSRVF